MKRFFNLLQPHLVRPILYSVLLKLMLGLCCVLLWDRFANPGNLVPAPLSQGFFFAGIYLLVWAWFQYLSFDGFNPLKDLFLERDANPHTPGTPFRLKDLINERIDAFSELEEEEQIVVKLCADLIAGIIFLAGSWIHF